MIQDSRDKDREKHLMRLVFRGECHCQELGLVTHLGQNDEDERSCERYQDSPLPLALMRPGVLMGIVPGFVMHTIETSLHFTKLDFFIVQTLQS